LLENRSVKIEQVVDQGEKELISSLVLKALPNWFGIPESTKEYIEQSRQMPFFVAIDNGDPIGFVALKETSDYTAEIYVMGVLAEYHNQGIGKTLFGEVYQWVKDNGF